MILAAWYHTILAILFAFVAIFLMLVILLQRGKGVGLAGAFGGAGGHSAFGSKTGDVLTWATIVIAGFFLLFAVLLNYVFVPQKPSFQTGAVTAQEAPEPPASAPSAPPITPATRPTTQGAASQPAAPTSAPAVAPAASAPTAPSSNPAPPTGKAPDPAPGATENPPATQGAGGNG